MTHVRTSPYYPQSNGKMARWNQTLKVTAIRPQAPGTLAEAQQVVAGFVHTTIITGSTVPWDSSPRPTGWRGGLPRSGPAGIGSWPRHGWSAGPNVAAPPRARGNKCVSSTGSSHIPAEPGQSPAAVAKGRSDLFATRRDGPIPDPEVARPMAAGIALQGRLGGGRSRESQEKPVGAFALFWLAHRS